MGESRPNGKLTYADAMKRARAGQKIKRGTWLAWLVMDEDGVTHFERTPKGLSKRYTPTGIDLTSSDWEHA